MKKMVKIKVKPKPKEKKPRLSTRESSFVSEMKERSKR